MPLHPWELYLLYRQVYHKCAILSQEKIDERGGYG